jgi:hypothetical protein
MDTCEKIVADHLAHRGYCNVVYEPDGNVPPDFLVNGSIAVEVRRLNQNEVTQAGARGLEETSIPFLMSFKKLLASLGPPRTGVSWFVNYSFGRPVPNWNQLRPLLARHLKDFRGNPLDQKPTSVIMYDRLKIDFFPASAVHSTFFLLGACHDEDSGGFLLHLIEENLRLCIREKSLKIASYRHKYPQWWLILIDLIGYGLDERDREMFQQHWKMEHDWDKIILLNPLDARSGFELK